MEVDGHKLQDFGTFRQFWAVLGSFVIKTDIEKMGKNTEKWPILALFP